LRQVLCLLLKKLEAIMENISEHIFRILFQRSNLFLVRFINDFAVIQILNGLGKASKRKVIYPQLAFWDGDVLCESNSTSCLPVKPKRDNVRISEKTQRTIVNVKVRTARLQSRFIKKNSKSDRKK